MGSVWMIFACAALPLNYLSQDLAPYFFTDWMCIVWWGGGGGGLVDIEKYDFQDDTCLYAINMSIGSKGYTWDSLMKY